MSTLLRRLAVIGLLSGLAVPAIAQTPPPLTPAPRSVPAPPPGPLAAPAIGIVDMALIQDQARAIKSIAERMRKEEAGAKSEFEPRERGFRTAQQNLQVDRTTLSAEKFAERQRDLERQAGDLQRDEEARRRQLSTAFADAMRQVEVALNSIFKEVANERGLNMILRKDALMLGDDRLDITEDVKQRLDKRLPNVSINLAAPKK
ncbi:MAG: OmpH family outer membrane protein [Pseudomonadota bacterium]